MPNPPVNYKEWIRDVNKLVVKACGLSISDLPDYRYADAFAEGEPPSTVAEDVIKEAKSF